MPPFLPPPYIHETPSLLAPLPLYSYVLGGFKKGGCFMNI
jgi:hypothetical protein